MQYNLDDGYIVRMEYCALQKTPVDVAACQKEYAQYLNDYQFIGFLVGFAVIGLIALGYVFGRMAE